MLKHMWRIHHKVNRVCNPKAKVNQAVCHNLVSKLGFLRSNQSHLSAKDTIRLPNITLWNFLKGPMHQRMDQIAVECGFTGRRYTYEELIQMSESLAASLQSLGVEQGDVVALCVPNLPEVPAFLLATTRIGAVLSPANPTLTPGELNRQLTAIHSKVLITYPLLLPVVEAAIDRTSVEHIIVINGTNKHITMKQMLANHRSTYKEIVIDPVTDAVLLPFSSGTTGVPKGVMLTHYNVVSNILQIRSSPHISEDVKNTGLVHMAVLPLFHVYAMVCILILNLHAGGKTVTLPMFSASTFLDTMNKYQFNALHLVPTLAKFIVESPEITKKHLKDVLQITCGSAPLGTTLAKKLIKKAEKEIEFTEGYGMTETSPAITMCRDKVGSIGQLVANTDAKVVDPTNKEVVGANQEGELYVRGPQVMKGYLNNPDATAVTIVDGWLRTGDIVWYDQDEYFYITGRIKELIKVKGHQVSPSELERLLKKHPGVKDACVVGVPDEEAGELPKAFIVKKDEEVTATDITEFLHPQVSSYKHLKGGIVFIDAIPRSAIGKVLRKKLLETDR